MTQRIPLTPKQIKIVKGKVAGKTGRDIGKELYPNASPEAQSVLVSRQVNKVNVQQALQEEFAKQGITIEAIVKPIADGLTATRTVIIRDKGALNTDASDNSAFADEVPDHAIRLKSSGMAAQFLGIGRSASDVTINFITKANEQRDVYDL